MWQVRNRATGATSDYTECGGVVFGGYKVANSGTNITFDYADFPITRFDFRVDIYLYSIESSNPHSKVGISKNGRSRLEKSYNSADYTITDILCGNETVQISLETFVVRDIGWYQIEHALFDVEYGGGGWFGVRDIYFADHVSHSPIFTNPTCNIANCDICSGPPYICESCINPYYRYDHGKLCLSSCPSNLSHDLAQQECKSPLLFLKKSNLGALCDDSCATCSRADHQHCTSCPAGKFSHKNQCLEACLEDTFVSNSGDACSGMCNIAYSR